MSALLAAQLYYHPDNAAVRQWLDQQWGDANDLPALDRVLPVVYRFANDEQVAQQFVMAITRAANRLASHTQSPADNQRAPTSMVALRRLLLAAADRIDWTDKQQRSAVETLTVFFVTGDAPSPQNISGASSRSQPGSRLLDTFRKMVQRETDHLRLSLRGTMPTTQRAALDARRLRWQQIYRQLAVPLALDWSTLLSPRPRSEPLVGQSAGEMETLFPAANRFVRDVGALRRVATRAAAHNQGQSLADRLHSAAGAWQPNGSPIRDKGPEDRRIAENGPLAVQAISLDVASSFVRWWSEDQRQAMEQLRSIAVTGDTQMEIRLLLIRAKAERGEMVEAWALISGQRQGPFAAQVAELERRVARRWANAARERSLIAHQGTVTALAFHPQGTLLASAGVDRSVRLWNPSTGTPLFSLDGHNDIVLTLAFSPDGKLLASAGYDRTIRLWDSQSAQSVAHWPAHEGAIRALRFLPDSRHLVSAGDDGSIRLWTLPLADTGSASPNMRQLAHLPTPGVSLAIDGSGDRLAVTTAAGGALVWQGLSGDVQAWQLTTLPAIPGASLRQLLFLPDQAGILAIADGQIAFRWHQDASGSWQRQELPLPASIRSIALVPPGNHVAMGGTDGRLRVWDWQSQKELAAVAAHPRKVLAVAVDPQKGRIASAGFDGTVQLWHAELGKARARKEAGQDSSE